MRFSLGASPPFLRGHEPPTWSKPYWTHNEGNNQGTFPDAISVNRLSACRPLLQKSESADYLPINWKTVCIRPCRSFKLEVNGLRRVGSNSTASNEAIVSRQGARW